MIWWMISCIGTEKTSETVIPEPTPEPNSAPSVEEEEVGTVDLDPSASEQGRKKKRMSIALFYVTKTNCHTKIVHLVELDHAKVFFDPISLPKA